VSLLLGRHVVMLKVHVNFMVSFLVNCKKPSAAIICVFTVELHLEMRIHVFPFKYELWK